MTIIDHNLEEEKKKTTTKRQTFRDNSVQFSSFDCRGSNWVLPSELKFHMLLIVPRTKTKKPKKRKKNQQVLGFCFNEFGIFGFCGSGKIKKKKTSLQVFF